MDEIIAETSNDSLSIFLCIYEYALTNSRLPVSILQQPQIHHSRPKS